MELRGISRVNKPQSGLFSSHYISGCGESSSGNSKRIQIGTGKHGVQPILVFHQSAIHRFLVAELALDDPERVFHLAAHRGLAVFNVTFPVNRVVADLWGDCWGGG